MIELCEELVLLESSLNRYEFAINNAIYMESVANSLDIIFKTTIHFLKEVGIIYNSFRLSHDTKEIVNFIEKTLEKNPSLKNKNVVIRLYKTFDFDNAPVEQRQILIRNMANRGYAFLDDKRMYELLKQFHFNTGYKDDHVKLKLGKFVDMLNSMEADVENDRNDIIKNLFNFKDKIKEYENEPSFYEYLKTFLIDICNMIKTRIEIIGFNIEAVLFQLTSITKNEIAEVSKKVTKVPSDAKVMKTSEKYGEIDVLDMHFIIYKTQYPNISCFNYNMTNIYLDNTFFNYPKGYQKAILFHEIGHSVSGHFGKVDGVKDEYSQFIKMKQDVNKFDKMVKHSIFSPTKALNDDSELLYILIELEADRFSSQYVGKHMMKTALTDRFNEMLNMNFGVKPKDEKTEQYKKFNQERMRFRTSLI